MENNEKPKRNKSQSFRLLVDIVEAYNMQDIAMTIRRIRKATAYLQSINQKRDEAIRERKGVNFVEYSRRKSENA